MKPLVEQGAGLTDSCQQIVHRLSRLSEIIMAGRDSTRRTSSACGGDQDPSFIQTAVLASVTIQLMQLAGLQSYCEPVKNVMLLSHEMPPYQGHRPAGLPVQKHVHAPGDSDPPKAAQLKRTCSGDTGHVAQFALWF